MSETSEAREKISLLIRKYEEINKLGAVNKYTEEDTKNGFIKPLFEALGWDFADRKEVTAEEHQSGGRVDYGFYLNSFPKFYLEAKSLKADLNKEEYANQAVRYSWNKDVPWAILTDFESLKVFNAQDIESSLHNKLFFEISFNQYLERFEQLWLLSKAAFKESLLDKEAEKYGKKLQKVSVTNLLYKDLNRCREILTNDLSQWNKDVSSDLLDEGIQKLLDRLLFIRVAEDRGVEPRTLIPLIREWENSKDAGKNPLYKSMIKKFRELDEIYNSNLFSPHPFEEWEDYSNATENVIKILYGKSGYYEYDFKAMPADVLGNVYENYLGYKLAKSQKGLTLDKNAKKRKEQGIYYTPNFIVDYIVKNALGPILDKCQSITDLQKIKVLDPACGSGSFLLKAMQLIADKYVEFGAERSTVLNVQILLNNIYGVDLDSQAVEIARLNLLVNALEGDRLRFPPFDKNIKNGNSLISGTDEELKKYFGDNYRDKKPFNWEEEFPEVFAQGGFDVVIGNPPYVRVDSLEKSDKLYWKDKYISAKGKFDLYYLFIEKSISLAKNDGVVAFITPNKFCVADSAKALRSYIVNACKKQSYLSVSNLNIFRDASNYPVVFFLDKRLGKTNLELHLGLATTEQEIIENKVYSFKLNSKQHSLLPEFIFPINTDKRALGIIIRLLENNKLGNFLKISEGLRIPNNLEVSIPSPHAIIKQFQFERYTPIRLVNYIKAKDLSRIISPGSGRYKNIIREKILIAEDALSIISTIDLSKSSIPQGGVYFAVLNSRDLSIRALLAVLNSRLMTFLYNNLFSGMHMGGGYLRYRSKFLESLPIATIPSRDEDKLETLVESMLLATQETLSVPKNSDKWKSLKTRIADIDSQIDQEVYKLYELTPEEVKIVEGEK